VKIVAPTLIDGVSSGGVDPAAGVTWAAAVRRQQGGEGECRPEHPHEGHTLIQAGSFVIDMTV